MSFDETAKQIISLTRFAVLCTLALAAILLFAELSGRRYLTETVLITFVCAIAAEAFAAIAALTCMALWSGRRIVTPVARGANAEPHVAAE